MMSRTCFMLLSISSVLANQQPARRLRGHGNAGMSSLRKHDKLYKMMKDHHRISPPSNNSGITEAPPPSIESVVRAAVPDASVFDDSSSYQSKALSWVESSSDDMSATRILQRFALACVYHATYNVPTAWSEAAGVTGGWITDDGWLGNANECSWHGISCNQNDHVEFLELASNDLSGSFPSEISLLKNTLRILDLTGNMLHNDGAELFGELTNLEVLLIAHNAIIDEGLPMTWQSLTKLHSLDASYCLFSGPINDSFFSAFPDLEYLAIGGNSFHGPIPVTIANLWSLKYLYIEYADLEGSLDPILKSNLPVIEEIWLDDNPALHGAIAPEVGQLTTLKSLSLMNCNLSGSIPDQIRNLVDMKQMWLSENNLGGSIPEGLSSMSQMALFYAHDNNLQGTLPAAMCNLSLLESFGADCSICAGSCCTCCGNQCNNV